MPTTSFADELHFIKHRGPGESFRASCHRVAGTLRDSDDHFHAFREILIDGRFSPAGRIWSAIGSNKMVTAYNCYVSRTIHDSMDGIMTAAYEAAQTLRLGGGIGYDFSTLRPSGDLISTLQSEASGPVSFMEIFNAICGTIAAAGHRRGAQMGILRVDHPDIFKFVKVKQNDNRLTNFNISVAVTNDFMRAVQSDGQFDLQFGGKVYRTIRARDLWDEIMRSTWDYAEPGVIFIDRVNNMNNLWYCENIAATNPCGEQPLPPFGACLLGSFNLTRYLFWDRGGWQFDIGQIIKDIPHVVRAMDNVIDRTIYPLPAQEEEAKSKRRMGLGVMGVANALEALGHPYGSDGFVERLCAILELIRDHVYLASINIAMEKGPFPLFDADSYLVSGFITTLPDNIRTLISEHGIRNSHLLSIAPTGTIAQIADNVSSGIEPVWQLEYSRLVKMPDGTREVMCQDYGYSRFGVRGKTADECSADEHLRVLLAASRYVDSAVSKTCNVGPSVSWEDFKDIYMRAWQGGAKGCTTFRKNGKRAGILLDKPKEAGPVGAEQEAGAYQGYNGMACTIDPSTGERSCS